MLSEGALSVRWRREVLERSSKEWPDVPCVCLEVRCLPVEKLLSGGALIVLRKETGSLMRSAAFPAFDMSRGTLHYMAVPRIGGSGEPPLTWNRSPRCRGAVFARWRCHSRGAVLCLLVGGVILFQVMSNLCLGV